MVKTLLLEIGVEEIPARFVEPAKAGLGRLLQEKLTGARIVFGAVETMATPRRLAVFVRDVAEKQAEIVTTKYGPPHNRAYDESGNPTKAAIGFAKSQGVSVEELKKGEKDNVAFVIVEKLEKGRDAAEVLPGILQDVIGALPFPKKMRWGAGSFEFARPIQWLLVLFGEKAIEFDVADVRSGSITYGHRFLSDGPIRLDDGLQYVETMRANSVIVKEEERKAIIEKGIATIEQEIACAAIRDEDLIREIVYITEYPYPLRGAFEETFLKIPKEVLVNVMKSHQRYIPVQEPNGRLMPYFICFANTVPKDDRIVIRGNEKVLRARLADADFFFQEDRKTKLVDLYERLSAIVFHVRLGTLRDKCERLIDICAYLGQVLGYTQQGKVERALRMVKSDLLTHMVGEFPELQGTMGRIYAKHEGEDDEVAAAIEEHYLPTGGNGALPTTDLGALIGVADKIDSVVCFFSVGISPTGNLDPYALRRQTLGIIKIFIDKKFHVSLGDLINTVYQSGKAIQKRVPYDETEDAVIEFILGRFKFSMIDEGHNQDFVESVLPFVARDIYDGYLRLLALKSQKSIEDFQKLMIGFKRAYNITKQLAGDRDVDKALFREKEEGALFNVYEANKAAFFEAMGERRYVDALSILVTFKETIDSYFDKVFVMDKDEAIKNNRLALLKKVKDMFLTYADFSKIRVE